MDKARAGGDFFTEPAVTLRSTRRDAAPADKAESEEMIFKDNGCMGKLGKLGVGGIAGTFGTEDCRPADEIVGVVNVSRATATVRATFESSDVSKLVSRVTVDLEPLSLFSELSVTGPLYLSLECCPHSEALFTEFPSVGVAQALEDADETADVAASKLLSPPSCVSSVDK